VSEIESPQAVEEIATPLPALGSALGHDPFDDLAAPDRFEEQLDQLEARGKQKPELRSREQRAAKSKATAAPPTGARTTARPAADRKATANASEIEHWPADPSTAPASINRRTTTRSDEHLPKPDNLARLTTSSKARHPTIDSVTRRRR
jgi:hypothetical protein